MKLSIRIALIVIIGAYLRFGHLEWDEGYQLHPDERAIMFLAEKLHLPADPLEIFHIRESPLNPFSGTEASHSVFPYGHFHLYLVAASETLLSYFCGFIPPVSTCGMPANTMRLARLDRLTYVGRALSALLDTINIFATFWLGKKVYSTKAGLMASALVAVSVINIQNACFGTVDAGLALFSTLTVAALVMVFETARKVHAGLAGMFIGLAMGFKITGVLLFILVLAWFAVSAYTPETSDRHHSPTLRQNSVALLLVCLLSALTTFAVTNPYVLFDPDPFLTAQRTELSLAAGSLDWPFTLQYHSTFPVIYGIEQQAKWGFGLPLTLVVYAGFLRSIYSFCRDHSRSEALILIWVVTVVAGIGSQALKFPRYLLPATPALLILGSGILNTTFSEFTHGKRLSNCISFARRFGAAGILSLASLNAMALVQMYQSRHPWIAASIWIYDHIPEGSTILVERWDDTLPLDIVDGPSTRVRSNTFATLVFDTTGIPDDDRKLRQMAAALAKSDYLLLATNRNHRDISRLKRDYPLASAYYIALFDGRLGYKLVNSFSRQPNLLGIVMIEEPLAGPLVSADIYNDIDDSFSAYDHPLVLIFANTLHLNSTDLITAVYATSGQ